MNSISIRTLATTLAAAGLLGLAPQGAAAQAADTYPDKPIHLVVPFPPGGAVDILGRLIGQHLGEQLNQSVVVENRAGANGTIAYEYTAKSAPDGYTILIGSNGLATNTALYPSRTFSELDSLAPIAKLGSSPLIMMVPSGSAYQSLKDVTDAAKAAPGKVTYASAGSGSSAHLGSEMLKSVTGTDMLHIPYKGGAPAIIDLTAGRVSFMLLDPLQALPQVESGRLRAIMVASPERLALIPSVPSATDAGYPKLEASVWWGFVAPKDTPRPIIDKLNKQINAALAKPDVQKKLASMGVTVASGSADDFGAFLHGQAATWGKLIKSAHISNE
ncbi:Bug family tripartite tricarboxylate transporter substrate binding protein [Bordetella petrii]|uniref:Bug family tripartite tricarboxylate transporter substrate binding protein n=1 Tax=Bordetella petrii TaxID=94624 RepID=UPI001A95E022|nr:tripartite tricarboxylate transporter substrate binding protein [Bordetella petrii]MBO1114031.1 tripartite tricarboxylate transporter substrate binding protein [Bordetella petrii]